MLPLVLEAFLGLFGILVEVRGGWQFRSGFLGSIFQTKKRRSFILRISYFCEGTSQSFFLGLLGRGVSNGAVQSDGCSPKDKLLEFRGMARRNGWMEGSGSLVFLFKKCKHRSVMEPCITLVKCNQVCI